MIVPKMITSSRLKPIDFSHCVRNMPGRICEAAQTKAEMVLMKVK